LTSKVQARGRELPVVYFARTDCGDKGRVPNQNAINLLAKRLGGLAHVAVEESATLGRKIRNSIDEELICEPGFIRVYWPGTDSQQLWRGLNKEQAEEIYEHIVDQLTNRVVPQDMRFERIRTFSAANNAHDDELEEIYESALREQKGIADEATARLYEATEKVQGLEREVAAFRKPMSSLNNLVTVLEPLYENSLIIHPRVYGEIKKSPFRHIAKARDALVWLATNYHQLVISNQASRQNCELSCSQNTEFQFRAQQGKQNMRKHRDQYFVQVGDEEISLERHLKYGANNDPSNCLRIAFGHTEDKVVVGYIGHHQEKVKKA